MTIQIDLQLKVITMDTPVNLGEFIRELSKLFPEEKWKDFELHIKNTHSYIPSPHLFPSQPEDIFPWQPTYQPTTISDSNIHLNTLDNGGSIQTRESSV